MDLAVGLSSRGVEVVFAGLGPRPSAAQRAEAENLGTLRWLNEPLDWMAGGEADLDSLPGTLLRLAEKERVDLLHLNLPSQAYRLDTDLPVVAVSHSCVATWFRAVRGEACPPAWRWQETRNREGLLRADAAVAPSRSHARPLESCYGPLPHLSVVHNAAAPKPAAPGGRQDFALAAGRWWDDGKNGRVLDRAAALSTWPVRMAGSLRGPNGQGIALERAEALGELPPAALRSLMAQAGIFVSPSLYEPFGLAALEAALAETPLVLADIPTYRELWDGAALFAEPRSARSFADAINHLAADPKLRAEMGRLALARGKTYSPDRQLDAMLSAYAQARAAAEHTQALAQAS
jgi:hypothetical protein